MTPFNLLLEKIHQGVNPYTNFPANDWCGTWYGDPGATREIFNIAIDQIKPGLIVEVGSFVGESAIHMANFLKWRGSEAAILCVDTWYAGYDHWKGAREKIVMHFGRPNLYYKFLANVVGNQCEGIILPFATDSLNGARVLAWLGIVPQLIYIDASHEQGDVLRDLEAYWALLPTGGGLLVDDISNHFPGVVHDWLAFMKTHALKPHTSQGEKALVIKP